MALQNKAYLKSKFETGDIPTQQDFVDWMDSIYIYGEVDDAGTGHAEGKLFYNTVKKALSYYNENTDVEVNIGQEVLFRVPNNSGATIPNGTIVTPIAGTIVAAERSVKLRSRLIGVTTHDIPNGELGYVTRLGEVGGLDTSMFSLNQLLYLGDAGAFVTTPPDDGSYTVVIGVVSVVHATEGVIIVDPNVADLTVEVTDTNGFPPSQRAATTLSVNNGTRTFSVTPDGASFHYYVEGDKFSHTDAQNVVFSDTEGNIWFYFDKVGLQYIANPTIEQKIEVISKYAFVAYVYWNQPDSKIEFEVLEERHGISMSPASHIYNHITRGTQYGNGLTVGNIIADASGALDTHAQFSSAAGVFYDEDLDHIAPELPVGSTIPVAYLIGAGMLTRVNEQTNFAVLNAPAGRLYYNQNVGGTWQLTEVTNNDFVLYHVFAINGVTRKIATVVGQNVYATVSAARAGATTEIEAILSAFTAEEGFPIATIIYQTSDGYANAVKARIRTTDTGDDYINWLTTELAQGSTPGDHQNLSNLQIAGPGVPFGHVNNSVYNEIQAGNLFKWQYNNAGTDTDPGSGKFIKGVGFINISITPYGSSGADMSNLLLLLKNGGGIYLEKRTDPQIYKSLNIIADATDQITYIHIATSTHDEDFPLTLDDICGFAFIQAPGAGGGGAAEREIVVASAWDGTLYNIDLSVEKQFTRTVNNGVTAISLGLSFAGDSNTKSREIIVVIDNSANLSAISTITFDDNAGAHTWNWSVGDPITSIAAGAIVELSVRNRSNTTVKALTDTEA